ncbi:cobyrinate a,c-diamide synthase [Dyadobacter sp. CY312]|uniref:cobyrinate a,c-diamide synthase n=1 Tax=Dyadobacter sp. CY312 TaxID=2907303 RepID=UPI001F3854AA|nr:cobyrinate a,c-diamide synthase [Dyadobacter sp. CY312]MCE7040841.1 cobyrinate a,c-diamide synthase [Dyadobacter sp. CY312]
MAKSNFLISAPSSNSGKTTLTLALLRALKNKGLTVQPFKCGPDYIDTIHHTKAAGRPSVNLDTFMSSDAHVQEIYAKYSGESDVAVTEGVMGLFDGADRMQGSSAAIAELLDIPVILVINAKSMAYSAAPLLYGFKNFCSKINLVGAIFNFVNSESHYRFLQDACSDVGIEALGYLRKNEELIIPSRHLGLHISAETDYENIIDRLAAEVEKTVDLNRLLEISVMPAVEVCEDTDLGISPTFVSPQTCCAVDVCEDTDLGDSDKNNLKIAIARDEAFSFTYHQNIKVLSKFGTITWFSPIHDTILPETDFLYLPGGYPELYGKELSANKSLLLSIKQYCETGGLTFAECGGLMYLGNSIIDKQGESYEMAGVLNCSTSMQCSKMTLGYRIAHWNDLEIRGHEFHYSGFAEENLDAEEVKITNAKGIEVSTKLYRKLSTFASYMHVYWGEKFEFIQSLIKQKANS